MKRDTNGNGRLRNISVNHHTGAEYYSEEEDSSGVQVEEYTDEEEEDDDEDDDEEEEEEDDEWDYIDEIQPCDSASRPQVKPHHAVPPRAASAPRAKGALRASSRHGIPVSDPPSRHRSRSRTNLDREHRPRRQRPRSVHADNLEDPDDYPHPFSARPGGPPGHPSQGWGHIPQPGQNGYAPSMMSDPRYHGYPGGPTSPSGQLVPFGHDPILCTEPVFAQWTNPFTQGQPGRDGGYFPDYPDHHGRPGGHGRRASHRGSMPPPPQGEMMPYSPPMGYYPPPYGSPYGMPPMYPPFGHRT